MMWKRVENYSFSNYFASINVSWTWSSDKKRTLNHISIEAVTGTSMVPSKPHAALLASPGMGHLIPTVELGKRLLTHHGFDVTIFVVTTISSTTTSLILQQTSNLTALNIVVLPPIDLSTKVGLDPSVGTQIVLTILESIPLLRSSFLSMKLPPSALIVDLFGTVAIPLARELGMSTYIFLATSAWFSAVTIYLPFIDKEMEERHTNNHEPLFIPGCEPIRFEDTLEPFLSPGGPMYQMGYLPAAREVVSADGILMNTWQDLEPVATNAMMTHEILGRFSNGPVYPVGPLVRTVESKPRHGEDQDEILRWLDKQPAGSVIYVSFGSGGTMPQGQMTEIALGLELSQQRFVWVVRPPNEADASATFFGFGNEMALNYLPEGFMKRTREFGVVVPMWAPQAEILGHPATGGFVTHCGWNSVLESVLNGVPMVAWPLYSEQKMNAYMLSEELGVAVRVKVAEGGVVCRDQVVDMVRRVMVSEEGMGMKDRVRELKLSGDKALSEFGSSHEWLSQMTKDFELHLKPSTAKARGA
ncbi:UDP-glycosyltransferase 72E1-like [Lotus japonicus]|uniref:UDP-glycosyltransferase 72E1-like n=1 Tax=Lotus japonicus TaxID=34305 RepID=UPI002585CCC7|nr:UDP-glycosyltransferase 72E1-like [Lotus japonicus]